MRGYFLIGLGDIFESNNNNIECMWLWKYIMLILIWIVYKKIYIKNKWDSIFIEFLKRFKYFEEVWYF